MSAEPAVRMTPLIPRYEAHLRFVRRRASNTVSRYVNVVREFEQHLLVEGIGLLLQDAKRSDVEAFLVAAGDVADSTWNVRRAALVSLYQLLVDDGLVAVNPAKAVPSRRTRQAEKVPLTLDRRSVVDDTPSSLPRAASEMPRSVLSRTNAPTRSRSHCGKPSPSRAGRCSVRSCAKAPPVLDIVVSWGQGWEHVVALRGKRRYGGCF